MRKIIYATLAAMFISGPILAAGNDDGARWDQMKNEMRALQDRHVQERRALEDECHSKMKAMRERHEKEHEDLKVKYGMEGKGGRGPAPK